MATQTPLAGDELPEEDVAKQFGFTPLALQQRATLRLFDPWPVDSPPPPNRALLSIASKKELLAAFGNGSLILVKTADLRAQYIPPRKTKEETGEAEDEPLMKNVAPTIRVSCPTVSHVAFSADESCLVLAVQDTGELLVYSVDQLLSGQKEPGFRIPSVSGSGVRHLLPNPSPDTAHYFAVVTENLDFALVNLSSKNFVSKQGSGHILKSRVYGASWSKIGKQVVVGLEDGSSAQIDREGESKAVIPRPPQLDDIVNGLDPRPQKMVPTAISWITTHEFLFIYTPIFEPAEESGVNDSYYFLASRPNGQQPFTFRSCCPFDPCFPSGARVPAQHVIQRLSDWKPKLKDALIITSTASFESTMLARFEGEDWVLASIPEDVRRLAFPKSVQDGDSETSPVGSALDFSGDILISNPTPEETDLITEAPLPLPIYVAINTDGLLYMWWIVYNSSIKEKELYPALTKKNGPYKTQGEFRAAPKTIPIPAYTGEGHQGEEELETTDATKASQQPSVPQTSAQPSHSQQSVSTFMQPEKPQLSQHPQTVAPKSSLFQPPQSTQPNQQTSSAAPKSNPFQLPQQPQSTAPKLASPFQSFDSSHTTQPPATTGFGASSALGGQKSVWGSSNPTPPSAPSFGKPSTPAASGPSFGKPSTPAASSTAFGQPSFGNSTPLAQGGGFGQLGNMANKASRWGAPAAGGPSGQSPFGKFASNQGSGFSGFAKAGGFGSVGQQQGSSFGMPSQKPALPQEQSMGSTATINSTGSSFSWGQPTPTGSFGAKSTEGDSFKQAQNNAGGFSASNFKLGTTFKPDGTAKDDLPKPKDVGWGFGGLGSALGDAESKTPPIKKEAGTEKQPNLQDIPEKTAADDAPLPPDPMSYKAPKMPSVQDILSGAAPKKDAGNDAPVAGSPPIDLGNEQFSSAPGSELSGPGESEWDDEDEDEEDEEGEDDEEENKEEENENSQDDEDDRSPVQGSFLHRVQLPPSAAGEQKSPIEQSTTPASNPSTSYTPTTVPKGPPMFKPPPQESPRSPSPVKRQGGRASETPLTAPVLPKHKPVASSQPQQKEEKRFSPDEFYDASIGQLQATTIAPLAPRKELPHLVTYSPNQTTSQFPGTPGLIHQVWMDANEMLKFIGRNARELRASVAGHDESSTHELGDYEGWVLGCAQNLETVLDTLGRKLNEEKIEDPARLTAQIKDEMKINSRLKAKTFELKKSVAAFVDPKAVAENSAAPLAKEMQIQQSDLRHATAKIQKLLSEVEDKLSLLRADLVSAQQKQDPLRAGPAPTLEAVTNTIAKMTAMAEAKSGDVDMLEVRIRQLSHGLGSLSIAEDAEDDLVSAMAGLRGSPSRTPPRRRRVAADGSALGLSGMFGRSSAFRTPPSSSMRASLMSSGSGPGSALGRSGGSFAGGSTPRKTMADVGDAEVRAFQARKTQRASVLGALKANVEGKGARIVSVG